MRTAPLPRLASSARLFAAALALFGAVLLLVGPSHAAGTVTITDRAPQESDGRWKLKMTINYGSTPHLGHIPMLFSFTPVSLYERSLTDQSPEKPVLNKIPLKGQQSINEDMDVGFSDGSGKIFNITKFDFVLRRDRGFEAGEYELKITRKTDGAQMGSTQKITLQGDNPIVDRRAIVFAGDKKKDKKKEEEKKKAEEPAAAESGSADEAAGAGAEEAAPADTGEAPVETPPEVEPKQGGCGCRVAGEESPAAPGLALGAGLALAVVTLARRRRSRAG